MAFVCYLHLCSQRYIVVHIELVDALSQWQQRKQQRHLRHITITKFLAIQPARYRVWHSENLLHRSTLWFTATIASAFFSVIATHVLASITSSKLHGLDSVHAHAQSSRVYLMSTLDITHMIKCNRLPPLLNGENLETRLEICHHTMYINSFTRPSWHIK